MGLEYLATGHYARIRKGENGRWQLLKGPDPKKDQSYVLYALTQEQLSEYLNVSVSAVSQWESGKTVPDVSTLLSLASFFDMVSFCEK
mgnify:CR=1 FL=1